MTMNVNKITRKGLETRLREAEQLLANWIDTANLHQRNADYYRGLVVEIGELFGAEAKTADDGAIHEDVLCAKVPKLVRKYLSDEATARYRRARFE